MYRPRVQSLKLSKKTELFILIEIYKSMHFKNNDASLAVKPCLVHKMLLGSILSTRTKYIESYLH